MIILETEEQIGAGDILKIIQDRILDLEKLSAQVSSPIGQGLYNHIRISYRGQERKRDKTKPGQLDDPL